jgi:hypothetical protein
MGRHVGLASFARRHSHARSGILRASNNKSPYFACCSQVLAVSTAVSRLELLVAYWHTRDGELGV